MSGTAALTALLTRAISHSLLINLYMWTLPTTRSFPVVCCDFLSSARLLTEELSCHCFELFQSSFNWSSANRPYTPSSCTQSYRLPLDPISNQSHQSYIASQIAPFASQLVAQVLSCPASDEPTHIRFLLNDGVVPLTGIHGCTEDSNGLCALSSFISGMHERIGEINFAHDCFANYTMPNPDNIIDGRYPS